MPRATHEVADVIRLFGDALLRQETVSPARQRVMRAIQACRTSQLGGHIESCDLCDYQRIAYNSCRNRHCPKCQGSRQAQWLEDRAEDLLPVEYFHVVFTVPEEIAAIALQNKRIVYAILFAASSATLRTIAADEKHLGAEIGFVSVLHTWTQDLRHHPHVHCVVPGGGLAPDGRWVTCRPGFFLPVRVLGAMFRGKFVAALRAAFERGDLQFQGSLQHLHDAAAFAGCLDRAMGKPWVVYSKPPFGGPLQVLKYLARYTHRVAISNSRILGVGADGVSFRWRDRAQGNRPRTMVLPGVEFLRRFLQHVLPRGFQRLRHYGLLGNRGRTVKLAACRLLMGATMPAPVAATVAPVVGVDDRCPACGLGRLHRREFSFAPQPEVIDSS
ncbi:MAG: IS91 family transposase [Planctomycetota bacterium]|nr:IS91 family transposase [Planctomycetota bacterium]